MRAIQITEQGGPEVLRLADVAVPEPGPGQARVKLAATGVNFIELYQRGGQYKLALPAILGTEAAGTVEALGPGAESMLGIVPGARVASASMFGTYAEYALAPVEALVAVPEDVELTTAAAVMLQGMTAHYLAHSTFPLQKGQTALVHAAAGGVGHLLTQIAKLRGARVIATASTEEKIALARRAGADEVIPYTTEREFAPLVRELTGGRGVEVVYDSVGKDTFDQSLDCLARRGMLVLFGQSSGAVPPFNPQILNAKGSLFLTRPTLGHYTATREELTWRAGELFQWMGAGQLEVRVDQTFPLAEAAAAHHYLADRKSKGKVLLVP
ncbi:MAG TPA: quinone oxidoreductase [Ktedonobacterales bacterium]